MGWYTFSSPRGDKYRYRLESLPGTLEDDVSTEDGRRDELMKYQRREFERGLDKERYQRLVIASRDFDPSPIQNYFQYNGYNELVKATGFDSDHSQLYVEYELNIPPGWMWSPRDPHRRISSCTHVAQTVLYPSGHPSALNDYSSLGSQQQSIPIRGQSTAFLPRSSTSIQSSARSSLSSDSHLSAAPAPTVSYTDTNSPVTARSLVQPSPAAHFGHPIEFEVLGSHAHHAVLTGWPTLFFQVNAIDYWTGQHRAVGYGYLPLPRQAGSHVFEVKTWAPVGSLRAQLQNFYVGGSPTLRELSASGIPTNHDPSEQWLNKFGWTTRSSGSLHVRCESIFTTHYQPKQYVARPPARPGLCASVCDAELTLI